MPRLAMPLAYPGCRSNRGHPVAIASWAIRLGHSEDALAPVIQPLDSRNYHGIRALIVVAEHNPVGAKSL
jgi:hypothetical protein